MEVPGIQDGENLNFDCMTNWKGAKIEIGCDSSATVPPGSIFDLEFLHRSKDMLEPVQSVGRFSTTL